MTIRFDFPNEGPFYTESFVFNAGEVQATIPEDTAFAISQNTRGTITARIHSSNDLMELIMITDAYKRINPVTDYTLLIPYLPYSRQDRVANRGEALSAKVFADMINALNFKKVFTYDAHSDVSVACLTNCEQYDQVWLLESFGRDKGKLSALLAKEHFMLISPDAGANKKTLKVAQHYGGLTVINCDKSRDTRTGAITGTVVHCEFDYLQDKNLLIVDDICDGGMTFIKIAEALQVYQPESISLYVTHGIFSKGKGVLYDAGISHIYTTDSFPNDNLGLEGKLTVSEL